MMRVALPLALALAACGSPAPAVRNAPSPIHQAPTPDVVATYQRCWKLWNTQWTELGSCYDDAIVSEEPGSGTPPWRGKEAVMGHVQLFKQVFPDATGDLQLVLANGRRVVGIALVTGTHRGAMKQPAGALPPTGKRLGLYLAHQLELNDAGSSINELIFLDHAGLWGQLGLYPGPHRSRIERGWPKQVVVVADHGDQERRNLDAYRRRIAHHNAHDARAVAGELSDTVVWSDAAMPSDLDKQAAIRFLEATWRGFSDLTLSAPAPWAAGAYVVSVGVMEGTNDGELPLLGLPKTGRRVSLPFLEIVKFDDTGKVAATWMFYDGLGLAMQLAG